MGKPGHELTQDERRDAHNRHWQFAEQVQEMFARGESLGAISRVTGIPKTTVYHMVKRLSADYVRERYGDATAVLGRELQILDTLTRNNLPRAREGDASAARIVLDAHVRRSKLLGLEAAVKAELTVRTSTDIEIERLVAMLGVETPEAVPEPENGSSEHTASVSGE